VSNQRRETTPFWVLRFFFFSYLHRSRVSMSRQFYMYSVFMSTYVRNQSFRIWKPHRWSAKSVRTRCPWSTRLFHCSVSTFVTSIRFHYLSRNPYLGKRQFAIPAILRTKVSLRGAVIKLDDTISRWLRVYQRVYERRDERDIIEKEWNREDSKFFSYCTCNFFGSH